MTFKVKVMPSQGHGVQEFMNWTTVEDASVQSSVNKFPGYSPSYHLYSKDTSLIFSTFNFTDEMVPAGDSQDKCVYLEVAVNSEKNIPSAFKPLENMPDCSRAKSGWWNFHDPKIGIDLPTWYQEEIYLDCSGKACFDTCTKKGGLWVLKNDKSKGVCYTYTILNQICIKVAKYTDTFGKVHWKYTGGCFKDDKPGEYINAVPGKIYRESNVNIVVRADDDPYVLSIQGTSTSLGGGSGSMKLASILLFVVSLCTAIGAAAYYFKLKQSGGEYHQGA